MKPRCEARDQWQQQCRRREGHKTDHSYPMSPIDRVLEELHDYTPVIIQQTDHVSASAGTHTGGFDPKFWVSTTGNTALPLPPPMPTAPECGAVNGVNRCFLSVGHEGEHCSRLGGVWWSKEPEAPKATPMRKLRRGKARSEAARILFD